MAPLAALGLIGLGAAAVAVATSDGKDAAPAPDSLVFVPPAIVFPPIEEPAPPRTPIPELTWHEAAGDLRIDQMARSPRFNPKPPGNERVVLAELADLTGRRGKSFRVLADVYIEDTNDTASLVALARSLKRGAKPAVIPALRRTAFGERIARRFKVVHGQAIGFSDYSAAGPIATQLPLTPPPPRYVGANCNTIEQPPTEWQSLLADWGIGDARALYLFDTDACGERGPAYPSRRATGSGESYVRQYNLRLEGEGSRVVLTAEIARLPLTQLLRWRAFYAV